MDDVDEMGGPEGADIDVQMLEYFSVAPYRTEYVDGVGKRIACDVPTVEGFCGGRNMSVEELGLVIKKRTADICLAKFKNIMLVNGLHGLYESGPWGLTMKNLARWADKSEVVTTRVGVDMGLDEMERILKFLVEKRRRVEALAPVLVEVV